MLRHFGSGGQEKVVGCTIALRMHEQTQSKRHTVTHDEVRREAGIKVADAFDELDLLSREADIQSVEIVLQMLHLAPSDYGEDICGLVHDICNRH